MITSGAWDAITDRAARRRLEAEKERLAKRLGAPILEPGEDVEIVTRLEEIAEELVRLSKSHHKQP